MNWQVLALLGAYHGINPGMGWLFAVALGMQRGSGRGVWCAVPPIAIGHAAAVGVALLIVWLAQIVVPVETLRFLVAAVLVGVGLDRFRHHRHPRFGGMQVGFRDLTIWSFLMASAHGAGVMAASLVMSPSPVLAAGSHQHLHHVAAAATGGAAAGAIAVAIHTAAYLVTMTLAAWVVYRKLGVGLLRAAWLNVEWIWAGALVLTGLIVLLK